MGSSKDYEPNGGFNVQRFNTVGTTENSIKIIEPNELNTNKNTRTPIYSNTPGTMYAKTSSKQVDQVSIYGAGKNKRQKLKDIDIGHPHTNPNRKKHFKATDIHVHVYHNKSRSFYARKPSKKEKRLIMIARYGKR